jgi:glycosyltransferase involved in cell wall biosynthesis
MDRIALNGRFSGTPQPTGTQTVAFALFDAIVRTPDRDVELVIFADPRFDGVAAWRGMPGVTFVETPFQSWSRGKAQLWEQFVFPIAARRHRCKVSHHPIMTAPIWKNGLRSVVTLHDLNFFHHPEWFSWKIRAVFRLTAIPGLHRGDRVVTISDYVCADTKRTLGISDTALRRIYNGVKPLSLSPEPPPVERPYLLCVGSLQPHKNLARLIRAYRLVQAEFSELELRVVGRPQPRFAANPELPGLLETPGVKVLGYLTERELGDAYRGAELFCYPSFEEGFGLPLLEAMTAGTLTLTSNASCLPEIAGGHSALVDPKSDESLAAGIRSVLKLPPAERAERIAKGREWAAKFSWQNAARDYLALYRELL